MRFAPTLVALAALGFAAITFLDPVARACSCAQPPPPKESMEKAAAVFSGKVVKIEADAKNYEVRVTIEVSRVWKGDAGKAVTVVTGNNGAICGVSFHEGDSYLVYAYAHEDKLHTNICTRTQPLAHAKEDLDALGKGKEPAEAKKAKEGPPTTPAPEK